MPLIASATALTPFGSLIAMVEAKGNVSMRVVAKEPERLSLPEGVAVDGCRLFAMTIEARSRASVAPSVRFRDRPVGLRFGPASRQHLVAAEFADKRGVLVLATHDGPWLSSHAARHGLLPERFAALREEELAALVQCREDGLSVAISQLERNESVRLYFSAAGR